VSSLASPRGGARLVRRVSAAVGAAAVALVVFVPVQLSSRAMTGKQPGRPVWVAAAAAVALLVPLLRPLVDRVADRLAYGRAGDPYAVVSAFVSRLSGTLAVEDVLPHLARTAAEVVHGPAGDVTVWLADGRKWHESWQERDALSVPGPREPADAAPLTVPLAHAGTTIGELGVELPGMDVAPAARQLLQELAGPAGLAVSNVRLTVELRRRLAEAEELAVALRRSRDRLVQARTEQRTRFSADVAGRVQEPLSVVDSALAEIEAAAAEAAARAAVAAVWDRARAGALAALEALRELAHGIYPPVLGARGIAAALELRLDAAGLGLEVSGDRDARYSEEVEAVTYFCSVLLVEEVEREVAVSLALDPHAVRLTVVRPVPDEDVLDAVRDRVDPAGGTTAVRLQEGRAEVVVELPAVAVEA